MILVGLNDLDIDGEWLVERQALWVVPPELKESLASDVPDPSECFYDPLNQEVYVFKLEDCALKALQQVTTYTHTHTLPFIVNTCTCITVQLETIPSTFL